MALDVASLSSLINSSSATNAVISNVTGGSVGSTSQITSVGTAVATGTVTAGPWGGIIAGATSLISSIFGGKAPSQPSDGGLANATAINAQRDVVRASPIYQYYAKKGALANADAPATLLEPPACDAFGSASEALRYIGGVLEAMRRAITSEPLWIKWADRPLPDGSGTPLRFLMGAPFGLGNPAQSIRVANETFAQIANWELEEQQKNAPVVPEIKTPAASGPVSATPGSAMTNDISTLALLLQSQQQSQQQFLSTLLPFIASQPSQPATPAAPAAPEGPVMAGFDVNALTRLAPILVVILMVGFIFSPRGIAR